MVLNNALFSSQKMDWETPQYFFEKLNKKYKFDQIRMYGKEAYVEDWE